MKKLLVLFAFIAGSALAQAAAPNDIDTVWFRWIYNVASVYWSPNDSTIAAYQLNTYPDTSRILFINSYDGSVNNFVNTSISLNSAPSYGQYSKDGKYLISESASNTPAIIDTKILEQIKTFENPGDYSRDYSISPTNKVVGISSDFTTLRVWDIATGKITLTKKIGMLDEVNWIRTKLFSAQYTPDGKYLIVSADSVQRINEQTGETKLLDAYTLVLDANSLETVKKIRDVYGPSRRNYVSKTGKYFAAETDMTNILRIIDIETEEVVFVINLSTANYGFDFSSDDKYIAYTENADVKQGIQIWDLKNKTKVYNYKMTPDYSVYTSVAFSNNDQYLLASDGGARMYLYRTNHFLSVEEEQNIQATVSYPNPSHGSITLDFTLLKAGLTETNIIDITGKNVLTVAKENLEAGEHTYTIDLSTLANGTYFIKIISGSSVSTQKFIKNN
jgi:WD40 repeat protein